MNITEKAVYTNIDQNPKKAIDLMTGYPSVKEIANELAKEIYERRYEESESFEFEYPNGEYGFFCDVRTYNYSEEFETSDPLMFRNGDEIDVPNGMLYEIDFEVRLINKEWK